MESNRFKNFSAGSVLQRSRSFDASVVLANFLFSVTVFALAPPADDESARGSKGSHSQAPKAESDNLGVLEAADSLFLDTFTLEFEIRQSTRLLGPDVGPITRRCKVSKQGEKVGITVRSEYHERPRYRPVGVEGTEAMDYDVDGKLIVWRPTRKWALSTPGINIDRNDSEWLHIQPNGAIAGQGEHTVYYEHAIGSDDSNFELAQVLMASGRGFIQRLSEPALFRALGDGSQEIVARGSYSGDFSGEWRLVAQRAGDSALTRSARFTYDGQTNPAIVVENEGILESDGVTLARSGSITFGPWLNNHKLEFTIISFSTKPDADHLKEIEALLRPPLPDGAHVVDMRKDRSPAPESRKPEKDEKLDRN